MLAKTALAAFLALILASAGPAGVRAQTEFGLAELAYEAKHEPLKALDRIAALLGDLEQDTDADPRLVFDLYRLAADLLKETGQTEQAADLVAQLADFAVRNRAILDIDPAPLFGEAARLAEAAGDLRGARTALENLAQEQRTGAVADAGIAATLINTARVRQAMGDQGGADRLRQSAAELTGDSGLGTRAGIAPLSVTPFKNSRGDDPGFREVDVYYATDRARSGDTEPATFYGNERGDLELGIATVTIPETHTPGVLEAPSIWRLEFRANPARHVVLQSIEPLDPDSFYGQLQQEFKDAPAREAFVFIHGYNVMFDQATRRAAQIAYDMNYTGVPILYSWPSWGSTVGYVADTAVVRLSGRRLSRFLEELVQRSGANTIHIVAHSMGNRALTDALELMSLRLGLTEDSDPVFGQVLFAAPDVDAGLFMEMLPTIRPIAERLTLYASEEDWALASSRKLHGNAPRAGLGGTSMLSNPAIDSIDMSELGDDMLAHSYFADDSSALADMMTLFWQNTAPAHRCGLVADDPQMNALKVWRYHKGVCADRSLIDVLAHLRRENVQTMEQARAIVERTVLDAELARKLEAVVLEIVKP